MYNALVRFARGMLVLFLVVAATTAQAQSIVVDNETGGFAILAGSWNTGSYGDPYNSNYRWIETTATGAGPASVEWRPSLPQTALYEVAVYYVQGTNRADNARFTVHHAGGSTPVYVNQKTNGETWVTLGSFSFDAGTSGRVVLDNDANPSVVIADAVRFTAQDTTVELTMEATPPGTGTTTPPIGGPYTKYTNEIVDLDATPASGYVFDHWSVSAGVLPADPYSADTTVRMDQSKTVTAIFVEDLPATPQFRAFWADAFSGGFKSTQQIDALVARAVEGNYNAILPEILAYQDNVGNGHGAYWNSAIVPKATDIVGSFDPLAYLIQRAHAYGIEVHPWLVAFRVSTSWPPTGNATLQQHPEWIMVPRSDAGGGPAHVTGKYTLDPGSPDVQEYLLSIVRELANNYDIDGLHWDYIRYTDTDAGYPSDLGYVNSGLSRFQQLTGYSGIPSEGYDPWEDFRRRTITEFVRRAQIELAIADNPRQPLRHSAALITWGNAPSNFSSTNSYRLFQNWRLWMEEGYLDTAIPMTYYDEDDYPTWYRNWVDQSLQWRYERHLVTGPGIYLNSFDDSVAQINYALAAGTDGICTYSYSGTYHSGTDWSWYPYLAASVFTDPAPVPPMTWRDPATATKGAIYGRVTDGATGLPLDHATIRINGFVIDETDGNGFFLLSELPASAGGLLAQLSVEYPGYADDAVRPNVLIERAGYTEANLALGNWLIGDYDVDGDVDWDDYTRLEPALTGPDLGPPPAGGDLFDIDGDLDVDLPDFATFQVFFGL
jgi:uncharacterized lipoprotein YddW (UPF0748 family)